MGLPRNTNPPRPTIPRRLYCQSYLLATLRNSNRRLKVVQLTRLVTTRTVTVIVYSTVFINLATKLTIYTPFFLFLIFFSYIIF